MRKEGASHLPGQISEYINYGNYVPRVKLNHYFCSSEQIDRAIQLYIHPLISIEQFTLYIVTSRPNIPHI